MAPLILNLGIKWKSAIGRTLRPLFPRGKNACTHLTGGLVGPTAVLVVLQADISLARARIVQLLY